MELSCSSDYLADAKVIKFSFLRLQTGGQGAIARRASASNAELHQLACVVPGDALSIQGEPVHQLARSWLQYRLTLASSTVLSKSKLPPPDFRAKAFESDRELTSTPNNSYGTFAKTIKTIN